MQIILKGKSVKWVIISRKKPLKIFMRRTKQDRYFYKLKTYLNCN